MSKTSAEVKNRYNAKAYDRILVVLKKGKKAELQDICNAKGVSVNSIFVDFVNRYIDENKLEANVMTEEMIRGILRATGMTEHDVAKHMRDGVEIYADNEDDKKCYVDNCIGGCIPEDEARAMWDELERVEYKGIGYKIEYCL